MRPAGVFPAYAGVFLAESRLSMMYLSLPRIRGGVSVKGRITASYAESSPHTRGCFCTYALRLLLKPVFPAYAGVFLSSGGSAVVSLSLPRIRGGVSMPIEIDGYFIKSSPHTRGCF